MSYLGAETKVADEEKKGSMIPIFGEAAGSFLTALGFGKKPDVNGDEKPDWVYFFLKAISDINCTLKFKQCAPTVLYEV